MFTTSGFWLGVDNCGGRERTPSMETRGRKERSAVGVHGVALLYGERLEHGASWVHSCSVAQLGGRSARPI